MRSRAKPKVFISYAWEDQGHKVLVSQLATRLKYGGFDVVFDLWHLALGEQITQFVEDAVRTCDFVLVVCTPAYKKRSDQRAGGVGYEQDLMTAERLVKRSDKFIPVLRSGSWSEALPHWLLGTFGVDLRGDPYEEENYRFMRKNLLRTHVRRASRSKT